MRWGTHLGVVGLLVLVGMTPAAQAHATHTPQPVGQPTPSGRAHTVTLLTGDRVTIRQMGNGRRAVSISPGKGRDRMGFVKTETKGRVRVVPRDALRLLTEQRLDPRLFDVTTLIGFGYDDVRRPDLPLIVTGESRGSGPRTLAGGRATRQLPAVDGAAMRVDKRQAGQFWAALTGPGKQAPVLTSGVGKVWLNGKAWPALKESVPQIGAPQAWQAGWTGKGVTVGVVDSGIDAGHPDLSDAVIAARDFTGGSDPRDAAGHGTHVSSIITGSGAASQRTYQGVAPDARLLVAKVCPGAECDEDAIIDGLTWTAQSGARVVNLSIGSCPSDGTDAMSAAVNNLTARTGTLFVISAGNLGHPACPTGPVSSPAAADSALAVGSVSKSDVMSEFSRTGPRYGDYAIKPDISAPGADIVAARAKDTHPDDPVGRHYARASGTSMAAPHVAGVAALLAQRFPNWRAPELKAALMNSARPVADAGLYAQGAGRVDAARALSQNVTATPAAVSLGLARWPGDPVTKSVGYTNTGTTPVTLALRLNVRDMDGSPAPGGLFTLGRDRVTVPARGRAEVAVAARPGSTPDVRSFGGWLTATGEDGKTVVRTPLGVTTEPERYDLTVEPVDRFGALTDDAVAQVLNLDTGELIERYPRDGRIALRLSKGRYHVTTFIASDEPGGPYQENPAVGMDPQVVLDRARTLRFDARRGKKINIDVGNRDASHASLSMGWQRTTRAGAFATDWSFVDPATAYVIPGRWSLPAKEFGFSLFTLLAKRGAGGDFHDSPFTYSLVFNRDGSLPSRPTWRVSRRDLARVEARYGAVAAGRFGLALASPLLADRPFIPYVPQVYRQLPFRRTEYYNQLPGLRWVKGFVQKRNPDPLEWPESSLFAEAAYRPGGTYAEPWNLAVFGPAFPAGRQEPAIGRLGNEITVYVPQLHTDQAPAHHSNPFEQLGITGKAELFRGGRKVGESGDPFSARFQVPPEPGDYRLTLTADRDPSVSAMSSRVQVSWSFRSAHVAGQAPQPLPVSAVRFAPAVNDANSAPAGRLFTIPMYAQAQATARPLRRLSLQVSYDGGASWRRALVLPAIRGWRAVLIHPRSDGYVSLKLAATDAAGNRLEQTIINAYHIAPS